MLALFPVNGRVELREVEVPNVGPSEFLVAMRSCGVCGTDLEKMRGEAATPQVLGHEVVGEVAAVGKEVRGFSIGDRVFVHHHVSCGRCVFCLQGSETMCEWFTATNLEPCGFAEFFKVPAANVARGAALKLPESVGFDEGTFVEPLGCCVRALQKSRFRAGSNVAVVGCGPMGLLNMMATRALGAHRLISVEVSEYRLKWAARVGSDLLVNPMVEDSAEAVKEFTGGVGVDLVIVATSNPKAFDESFKLVRRGGAICVFGAPAKNQQVQANLAKIFYDEVSIVPSYSTTEYETNVALKIIESEKIKPTELVTQHYGLQQASEAFRVASDPSTSMKVMVTSETHL